jgi:aspartyl-tRNA(Asn)/glutamyl-tRNA(Gln) amidotransferase subunit C
LELGTRTAELYFPVVAASDFNIQYVARLARIQLSPEEERQLGAQLGNILGFMEQLKTLDVSGVEPTAHAVPAVNVTRPDEIQPSLPHDEAMRNAPRQAGGLFVAPKIVE